MNDEQVSTPRICTYPQKSAESLRSRDETCPDISPNRKILCLILLSYMNKSSNNNGFIGNISTG